VAEPRSATTSPGPLFVMHQQASRIASEAGDSPTVILVHGSLDRAASFGRLMRRLNNVDVLAYDRRGYHRSRTSGPPAGLEGHVEDLVTLIESLGGKPTVLVGHSYGGDVALGAALGAGSLVKAVVAYEPPMPWEEWWPSRARSPIEAEDPALFAEGFFKRMVGEAAWNRLAERDREERRADGPALLTELSSIRGATPPFDVVDIPMPALFGRGGRSVPHHRRATAQLAARAPFGELFEIPGAAHGAHLSHPEALALLVRRALHRASIG
jgi:pimeloyl-ACP methyl ester carboxylesterase